MTNTETNHNLHESEFEQMRTVMEKKISYGINKIEHEGICKVIQWILFSKCWFWGSCVELRGIQQNKLESRAKK